jgi:hypothetical protein
MADHELEIKFTGDWSGLRTQAEREAAAIQSRFAGVGVGGGGGNAAAAGVPGSSPAVQQAVSDAFSRIDARRNAVTAATARTSRISDVELSPILRSARYELPEGGAEIVPLPAAATGGGGGGGGIVRGGGGFPGFGDRRGFLRMLAEQDDTGGGGGGRGGRFPLPLGRIARYATIGFIGREALQLTGDYLRLQNQMAFAGGDQSAQLAALRTYNQSVGLFGEVGASAADFFQSAYYGRNVSRLATDITERGAKLTDERTSMIGADRHRLDRAQAAVDFESAPNQFSRDRLKATYDRAVATGEIEDRRRERGNLTEAEVSQERTRLTATFDERLNRRYGVNDPVFRFLYRRVIGDPTEGLRREDDASVAALRHQRATSDLAQSEGEQTAADRLFNIRRRSAVLGETAYDVNVAGEIRANVQRGTGDPFGAQLTEINAQNTANLTTAANPVQRIQESIKGASRLIEFFGTAGRELDRSIADAQARTGQNRALLSGDTLGAYRIGAERARDRAIEALPRNVFFDRLRSAITGETQSEVERATEEDRLSRAQVTGNLQLEADVTGLQADQRPTAARARAIAGRARLQSQQLRGPDAAGNRMLLYQRAINEERILENEIVYGGRASVSEAGTTGGRGAREDQAAYQTFDDPSAIRDEIKGLRQDFNSSLIGGFRAGTIY